MKSIATMAMKASDTPSRTPSGRVNLRANGGSLRPELVRADCGVRSVMG